MMLTAHVPSPFLCVLKDLTYAIVKPIAIIKNWANDKQNKKRDILTNVTSSIEVGLVSYKKSAGNYRCSWVVYSLLLTPLHSAVIFYSDIFCFHSPFSAEPRTPTTAMRYSPRCYATSVVKRNLNSLENCFVSPYHGRVWHGSKLK